MKSFALAAIFSVLICAPLQAGSPRNPQGHAKITKNEAEHIALRRYPGARVTAAKLETKNGHLVWSLELATTKKGAQPVAVDAMSGRITKQ